MRYGGKIIKVSEGSKFTLKKAKQNQTTKRQNTVNKSNKQVWTKKKPTCERKGNTAYF